MPADIRRAAKAESSGRVRRVDCPGPKPRADCTEQITVEALAPARRDGSRPPILLLKPKKRVRPFRSLTAWFVAHAFGCRACNPASLPAEEIAADPRPDPGCSIVPILHVLAFGYSIPSWFSPAGAKRDDYDMDPDDTAFVRRETAQRFRDGRLRRLRAGETPPLVAAPRFVVSRRVPTAACEMIATRVASLLSTEAGWTAGAPPARGGSSSQHLPLALRALVHDLCDEEGPPRLFSPKRRMVADFRHLNATLPRPSYAYARVRDFARQLTHGAFFTVVDLAAGYTQLPLNPRTTVLCGFTEKGSTARGVYVRLPMGLATAPAIFSAVTAAAREILATHGVPAVSVYLDDFGVGAASEAEANRALRTTLDVFAQLGLDVSSDKLSPPAQRGTYLGILLDTVSVPGRIEIALPREKGHLLVAELVAILAAPDGGPTIGQVTALVGRLSAACEVFPAGRPRAFRLARWAGRHRGAWLREWAARHRPREQTPTNPAARSRAIPSGVAKRLAAHRIPLENGAAEAATWWMRKLSARTAGGPDLARATLVGAEANVVHTFSDASGTVGAGVRIEGADAWWWWRWAEAALPLSTTTKELVPVAVALALAGPVPELSGAVVLALLDNAGAAAAINAGRSAADEPVGNEVVAEIFDQVDRLDATIAASWNPREFNVDADALSKSHSLVDACRAARMFPPCRVHPVGAPHVRERLPHSVARFIEPFPPPPGPTSHEAQRAGLRPGSSTGC
jgi:hypothetical protein